MKKKIVRILLLNLVLSIGSTVAHGQNKTPKTVRDFFKLIPADYFSVFCCDENKDVFIKKHVSVEDDKNGFMEGFDDEEDPKYQGFVLKILPTANGRIVLGLNSHSIYWDDYYFLEYKNEKLSNVSKTIPNYSLDNIYEFPRRGSVIKVYKKKYSSPTKEINFDEGVGRGKYLYSLIWKGGKFTVKK